MAQPELGRFTRVFQWIEAWPPHRAEALATVLTAKEALAAGKLQLPVERIDSGGSLWSLFTSGSTTVQIIGLRTQTIGLVCRQRLGHAALALRESGLAVDALQELPAEVTKSLPVHPITGKPIVLVREKDGLVLRFASSEAEASTARKEAWEDNSDFMLALEDVEWWLTARKLPNEDF